MIAADSVADSVADRGKYSKWPEEMLSRLKLAITYSLEIVFAAVLALVFFLILFWLMNRFFPIGPGLDVLMSDQSEQSTSALGLSRSLWVSSGGNDAGLSARNGSHVATLLRIRNDVRSKKANAIAWHSTYKGLELFDQDSIQTFARSSAVIAFDGSNELELGPNTLIIIKRLESDLIWPERRTFMVMVDGELRGKVKPTGSNPVFVEIETPNAVASVQSVDGAGGVDFQIKVNSDASSMITVFEGAATVVGAGESVEIHQNETTLVTGEQAPTTPETLPGKITLKAPTNNKKYIYRGLPPKVKFSWLSDEHASAYRFVLARDTEFNDVVHETEVKENKFVHGNLKQGHYYWRIIGVNKNGGEGDASELNSVSLVKDTEPPTLDIKFPESLDGVQRYTLQGKAEVGAKVFIVGEQVAVSEAGEFKFDLELKPGVNVVVVEVVDIAGNVTYRSETVHGKF